MAVCLNDRRDGHWYLCRVKGLLISLYTVFFFCYIPWLQIILGTSTVPFEYFLYPIGFGTALLLSEETVCLFSLKSNISENSSVGTTQSR